MLSGTLGGLLKFSVGFEVFFEGFKGSGVAGFSSLLL